MSGSMPSSRYSLGIPTILPLRSLDKAASQLGTAMFRLVASFGSKPAIFSSMIAQSRTSRAIGRSEEHTSELQSLMRLSYAVFCLINKQNRPTPYHIHKYPLRHQLN